MKKFHGSKEIKRFIEALDTMTVEQFEAVQEIVYMAGADVRMAIRFEEIFYNMVSVIRTVESVTKVLSELPETQTVIYDDVIQIIRDTKDPEGVTYLLRLKTDSSNHLVGTWVGPFGIHKVLHHCFQLLEDDAFPHWYMVLKKERDDNQELMFKIGYYKSDKKNVIIWIEGTYTLHKIVQIFTRAMNVMNEE